MKVDFRIPEGHYNHRDLIRLLNSGDSFVSENSVQWLIHGLMEEGKIVRDGYESYPSSGKQLPAYSEISQHLIKHISNLFPLVSFTVIETQLLNEFLNQQIAQNTIFLQAEKVSSSFVFREFQKEQELYCLYKPAQQDLEYLWKKNCIIVYDRISESPSNQKHPHDVTAEKLIVDLYCDRHLRNSYACSEYICFQTDQESLQTK